MSVRVAVVGFGYVGACVGAALAARRYQVIGIDSRTEIVEGINRGEVTISEPGLGDLVRQSVSDGHLTASTDISLIADASVVIVTVGTPINEDVPDTSQVVLGLAFKDNTGDIRETPAKPVVQLLEESGCDLRVFDPLVTDEAVATITSLAPSKDVEDAISGADCVAFLTGHDDFRRLKIEEIADAAPGAVVIDGRMYFDHDHISQMRDAGLHYRGIGR